MADTVFWGVGGLVLGLLGAVVIFRVAARFVAEARRGNRRVREARDDPHVGSKPGTTPGERRDIGQ